MRQFWSSEETANALADEVLRLAAAAAAARGGSAATVRVACLSFPSAFAALLRRLQARPAGALPHIEPRLFEFDERFHAAYGERCFAYDYSAPPPLPADVGGCYDVFLFDPPYLTDECVAGYAATIAALRRSAAAPVLLCTCVMLEEAARARLGLRRTRFAVRHTGGIFANPFALYCSDDGKGGAGPMGGWDAAAPP